MAMKGNIRHALLIATVALSLWSCKKDDESPSTTDIESPTIQLLNPVKTMLPTNNTVRSLVPYTWQIKFTDDRELLDYAIEVRFDKDVAYEKTAAFNWSRDYNGTLSGKEQVVTIIDSVPSNPYAGVYKVTVTVHDKKQKETTAWTYIQVVNRIDSVAPSVVLTGPSSGAAFGIGDAFRVQGTINEMMGGTVSRVVVRMRNVLNNEPVMDHMIDISGLSGSSYALDTAYTVPAGTIPGDYYLEVYTEDDKMNVGRYIQPVSVYLN